MIILLHVLCIFELRKIRNLVLSKSLLYIAVNYLCVHVCVCFVIQRTDKWTTRDFSLFLYLNNSAFLILNKMPKMCWVKYTKEVIISMIVHNTEWVWMLTSINWSVNSKDSIVGSRLAIVSCNSKKNTQKSSCIDIWNRNKKNQH